MPDDITHIASPNTPVPLTFGNRKGKHIRALIMAEGELAWSEFTDYEYDSDTQTSQPFTARKLIDADWKQHPEEAAAVYSLYDGDKLISKFDIPALEDMVDGEIAEKAEREWDEVMAFAAANGIKLDSIHSDFCDFCLDVELGNEQRPPSLIQTPRPALNTPTVPEFIREPLFAA